MYLPSLTRTVPCEKEGGRNTREADKGHKVLVGFNFGTILTSNIMKCDGRDFENACTLYMKL